MADMQSSIYYLTDMSWVEVEALNKEKSCVLIPLSPIEEHGPHLPLGTDIFGARDIAELAANYCCTANPDLQVILTPVIPLGCAGITADFPGTISLRGQTLYNLVVDFCTGLAKSGFHYAIIVNHHLDSVHMKALLEAIDTVCRQYHIQVIETAGRILYSRMPLIELQEVRELNLSMKTEIHADIRETAYIAYSHPHLLKTSVTNMPAVLIDVKEGLTQGHTTFREMGANQGYIGSPAMASPELGKIHLEEQASITADLIVRLMHGEPLPEMSPGFLKYLKENVQL